MAEAATNRFPRTRRLSGRKAFARVFAARCSASNHFLVVYTAANEVSYSRLGLSAGRKLGGAVTRNRIKRLLREAFRLDQRSLPTGHDFVCVPRTAKATLEECRASLRTLCRRAAARAREARD